MRSRIPARSIRRGTRVAMQHRVATMEALARTTIEEGRSDGDGAVSRYELLAPIARGAVTTVFLARRVGACGFTRFFAAKRLQAHLADDPELVARFRDEARIGSQIRHPNVVPVLDVVQARGEAVLVLEYVHGVSLDALMTDVFDLMGAFPVPIAVAIVSGVLAGLHAAHEAVDPLGRPLSLVHRGVSPDNVLVSAEGAPRLIDFGVATATSSSHVTRIACLRGKLAYAAPEQLNGGPVSRTADLYATGVLLWELLTGRRLLGAQEKDRGAGRLSTPVPPMHEALSDDGFVSSERRRQLMLLEPIVARAVHRSPEMRFASAEEMAVALRSASRAVTSIELGAWVGEVAGARLAEGRNAFLAAQGAAAVRHESCRDFEISTSPSEPPPVTVVSSLSPPEAASRAGRFLWATGIALAAVLVAVTLFLVHARTEPRASVRAATAEPPAALPPPPSVDDAPLLAAPLVAAPLVAAPPPTGYASPPLPPPINAPMRPRSRPSVPSPRRVETAAADSAASATPPPCATPFYMVGTRKVFKAECL
jgi:eukaryotic-like serine/threonine-protein kinase